MRSIDTWNRLAKGFLLIGVVFVTVKFASAQTCTYKFTMVRSPEVVNAEKLREQYVSLDAKFTENEFDSMVKKRQTGYSASKIVQYKRVGTRLEGPLHGVNGLTLELGNERFVADENAFVGYYGSSEALGMVEVKKPESYRSVCPVYEERLLIGEGSLMDRYKSVRANLALKDKNDPNQENAKLTKEGFDVYFGHSLIYRFSFNEAESTLTITKMVPENFETLTYREIPNEDFEEFEDYVPIGATVSDYRLSNSFPTQYKWKGELPTLDEISKMKSDRGNRSTFPLGLAVSLGVVGCGAMLLVSTLVKLRRKD